MKCKKKDSQNSEHLKTSVHNNSFKALSLIYDVATRFSVKLRSWLEIVSFKHEPNLVPPLLYPAIHNNKIELDLTVDTNGIMCPRIRMALCKVFQYLTSAIRKKFR